MNECYSLNIKGRLLRLERPMIMGIVNVTPDSFFEGSRVAEDAVAQSVRKMMDDGADIIDLGACSTRPGSVPVAADIEIERLHKALDIIDRDFPDAIVSIDTFRADVVRECAANHNVSIINDVSAFAWDDAMIDAVVDSRLPYILTHSVGAADNRPSYNSFIPDVMHSLSEKVWQLRQRGVADVIIDPGFGFGKSIGQNYELLARLSEFSIFEAPVLVGLSRKSMITKLLSIDAADALNATTALNMAALMGGAHILRVHDVRAAVQTVQLFQALQSSVNRN